MLGMLPSKPVTRWQRIVQEQDITGTIEVLCFSQLKL